MPYEFSFNLVCSNNLHHKIDPSTITVKVVQENEFTARNKAIETGVKGKRCNICQNPVILGNSGDVISVRQV